MLLATDLDGTFLAGSPEDRQRLYQLVNSRPEIKLAFVTGRGLEVVMPLLADPSIPTPDYIICDVGATVVEGRSLQPVQPLQAQIDSRWPGERVVAEAMQAFGHIERQEVPQQRRCSYFCKEDDLTREVEEAVAALDCEILFSAHRYLDVLPRGINKGSTLEKLIELFGIEREAVLVAGDTLNDLAMFERGFCGVCVGESEPALLASTQSLENVFHAQRPGCAGILDALLHFQFVSPQGIEAKLLGSGARGKSSLAMVYHRLPFEEVMEEGKLVRRRPASPNGIIPTLLSFFAQGQRGSWIAWAIHDSRRTQPFETRVAVDAERYPGLMAARVPLTKEKVDIFYKRFSKEAFWPTLHTFWERASFREDDWEVFLQVNRLFAQHTAAEMAQEAMVWIHDYNLWMVPAFLREMRPDLKIAFFHHTYFPSADVFNVLPWRRTIISSLLQCDYIGFHIPRQVENFVDVARGVAPLNVLERRACAPRYLTYGCAVGLDEMTTSIEVHGRQIGLGAHPVGVDLMRIRDILGAAATRAQIGALRAHTGPTRIILSVERLDYTKGVLEKLLAFERLLQAQPQLQGTVTLITICVPAAREMTIYDELQRQIEAAVGRINGRFSTLTWTPVQFFFRSFPFEEVVAYYALADLMWITPLRDGLNLVCKEFVATHGLSGTPGILVLSEFAGAAAELHGALLTNPHDVTDLMQTLWQGITLSEAEAEARLRQMFDVVQQNDVQAWGRAFLDAARNTGLRPEAPEQLVAC